MNLYIHAGSLKRKNWRLFVRPAYLYYRNALFSGRISCGWLWFFTYCEDNTLHHDWCCLSVFVSNCWNKIEFVVKTHVYLWFLKEKQSFRPRCWPENNFHHRYNFQPSNLICKIAVCPASDLLRNNLRLHKGTKNKSN